MIESGKTIRLTKQSAIANEKRNQLVLVCSCLSRMIDRQTSKLPSVPKTTEIDRIKIGQLKALISLEGTASVKLLRFV